VDLNLGLQKNTWLQPNFGYNRGLVITDWLDSKKLGKLGGTLNVEQENVLEHAHSIHFPLHFRLTLFAFALVPFLVRVPEIMDPHIGALAPVHIQL